jgi:hypothetical protein
MKSHLQDIADVRAVVQLYVDGASGDAAKLKEAFHPDARMFGHIGDMATYIPIGDFIGMVESSPTMAGPNAVDTRRQAYDRRTGRTGSRPATQASAVG